MALLKCPDCGNMVSDRAPFCTKCGCPIDCIIEESKTINREKDDSLLHKSAKIEPVMVTRKEDTPQRRANRKYEEKNKEKRKAKCGNFQTMIPRELFDEINAFLKENGMTKVDFIRDGYEALKHKSDNESK